MKSTKLEDLVYADLHRDDADGQPLEAECGKKLSTFPALSEDVFQSFYAPAARKNAPDTLSVTARKFNRHILEQMTGSDEYATIKAVCEGREVPAYEAAGEFLKEIANEFKTRQAAWGFTVTGILLDKGGSSLSFSLEPFCDAVYRTSELTGDEIAEQILTDRV